MGRDDDDFEEDDFSLDDGTEDDKDDSASEASVAEDDDDDMEEDEEEEEEADFDSGSDFEGASKAKKAKTSNSRAPAKKPAAAAAKKKAAPAAKASPAAKKPAAKASASPKTTSSKPTSSPAGKARAPSAAAAAAAEKPAATIKGDPTAHVLDYMRKTNRPYSMLNVFENLHRAIAKPALTKILDNLADKEELASKTYGKAKIYYMNQNKLPVPSEDERFEVEDQIKQADADCVTLEQELKAAEGALSSINSQISDADLDKMLAQLEEEAVAMETKLQSLQQPGRALIPAGKKDALKRKFTTYKSAWVTRKRIVTDAVNQVADGMEKKPKAVYDLIGIETDADAGIKEIPSI